MRIQRKTLIEFEIKVFQIACFFNTKKEYSNNQLKKGQNLLTKQISLKPKNLNRCWTILLFFFQVLIKGTSKFPKKKGIFEIRFLMVLKVRKLGIKSLTFCSISPNFNSFGLSMQSST